MTDQLRINERGELEACPHHPLCSGICGVDHIGQPLTWDGEPLYSPDTIREALFNAEAFEQMRGQMTMRAGFAQNEPVGAGHTWGETAIGDMFKVPPVPGSEPGEPGHGEWTEIAVLAIHKHHVVTRTAFEPESRVRKHFRLNPSAIYMGRLL